MSASLGLRDGTGSSVTNSHAALTSRHCGSKQLVSVTSSFSSVVMISEAVLAQGGGHVTAAGLFVKQNNSQSQARI